MPSRLVADDGRDGAAAGPLAGKTGDGKPATKTGDGT
jgi:hypothetical protein